MFGLVTIGMNIAIYEAISRIPLGTAVAIEFLGPTAVAALGSRRRRDLAAVGLASAGVLLLAGVEFDANLTGVLFALVSAAMWAGYILVGKRVADTGDGLDSLAVGMSLAAVVLAPAILVPQARIDASVFADSRTWLLGLCIGLLSTAIPYALDQLVLVQIGSAKFALLLALLPVTATLIGVVVLRQIPTLLEITGIALGRRRAAAERARIADRRRQRLRSRQSRSRGVAFWRSGLAHRPPGGVADRDRAADRLDLRRLQGGVQSSRTPGRRPASVEAPEQRNGPANRRSGRRSCGR